MIKLLKSHVNKWDMIQEVWLEIQETLEHVNLMKEKIIVVLMIRQFLELD